MPRKNSPSSTPDNDPHQQGHDLGGFHDTSASSAIKKSRNRLVRNRKARLRMEQEATLPEMKESPLQDTTEAFRANNDVETPASIESSLSVLLPPTPRQQMRDTKTVGRVAQRQDQAVMYNLSNDIKETSSFSLDKEQDSLTLTPLSPNNTSLTGQSTASCTLSGQTLTQTSHDSARHRSDKQSIETQNLAKLETTSSQIPHQNRPPIGPSKRLSSAANVRHLKPPMPLAKRLRGHCTDTTKQTSTTAEPRNIIVRYNVDAYTMQEEGKVARLVDELTQLQEQITQNKEITALPEVAELLLNRSSRHELLDRRQSLDTLLHILSMIPQLFSNNSNGDGEVEKIYFDAFGIILHCVSSACTMQAKTQSAALTLRRTILTHRNAMMGICHLACTRNAIVDRFLKKADKTTHNVPSTPGQPSVAPTLDSPASASTTSRKSIESDNISRSSMGSRDRTKHGRRKRLHHSRGEKASVSRDSRNRYKANEMLNSMFDTIFSDESISCVDKHSCSIIQEGRRLLLPLLALQRIVTGRVNDRSPSCLEKDDISSDTDIYEDPVVETNRWLRESGALPFMASGFAEAIASAVLCDSCDQCATHLCYRVRILSSLIENACLLDSMNTKSIVVEGYTDLASGYLVFGVLHFLYRMLEFNVLGTDTRWGDTFLSALRTLTSLTHECEDAAKEIHHYTDCTNSEDCFGESGLNILARIFFEATNTGSSFTEQLRYDTRILVLNVFANMLDSSSPRKPFLDLRVGITSETFLQFLVHWILHQTNPFEEAILGAFGSSVSSQRELDDEETERLVTAGNGFVVLSYLLIDSPFSTDEVSYQLRELIFHAIPGATRTQKITFIKNVLKAFCNHYRSRVGDLYVVLKAPIDILLRGLDQLDYAGRSATNSLLGDY